MHPLYSAETPPVQVSSAKKARWSELLYAARYLDPDLLNHEPELLATKLPRYRGRTPASLNLEFALEYQRAFRWIFRWIDIEQVENVKGIDLSLFYPSLATMTLKDPSGDVMAVHRERKKADRHGLPYFEYILFCFEFQMARKRRAIPRPHQLTFTKFQQAFDRKFKEYFNDERRAGILARDARNHPAPYSTTPGCIGTVGALDPASPVCAACPLASKCAAICEKIIAQVADDTRADRKRALTRERVRRLRAKRKCNAPHIMGSDIINLAVSL